MRQYLWSVMLIVAGLFVYEAVNGNELWDTRSCQPDGRYGFVYSGTVYDGDSVADLSETGEFIFREGATYMQGSGLLRLNFIAGPKAGTDLTIEESFVSDSFEYDGCGGTIKFTAVWNDGSIFSRSVSYVTVKRGRRVLFQSTSPGTIATGQGIR